MVSEFRLHIGRKADVRVEQTLRVRCIVVDVRSAFGRVDYLISPVSGSGSQWVASDRVTLLEEAKELLSY